VIKTIIFDFGGVFLVLDKEASFRELKKLGMEGFSKELLQHSAAYEKGSLTTEAFLGIFRKNFPEIPSEKIIAAWNAILLEFPLYRLDFLKKLSGLGKYELILLSNTNDLHIKWVAENITCFEEFKSCFDGFYLSHEINFRKPDTEIYQFILDKHALRVEEVLFIDDTPENTKAAEKLGIRTWALDTEKEDVVELFSKNLL
jgi:putative hydrolase of the HAD superfamily